MDYSAPGPKRRLQINRYGQKLVPTIALVCLIGVVMSGVVQARSSGKKRAVVSKIIIHATGGPSCKNGSLVFSPPGDLARMARFFKTNRRVSIHYIIGRNGAVVKGIPENEVAIHARRHNDTSIGIELINEGNGAAVFPDAQMASLVRLVGGLRRRYNIKLDQILRHSEVDHSTFRCGDHVFARKQDPGPALDWRRFQFELLLAGG